MKEMTDIKKWMIFIFNFPSDFIEKIWADDPSLVQHFKGKFNNYYERFGSYGVIPAFYGDLSYANQKKMEDWVINNFNA